MLYFILSAALTALIAYLLGSISFSILFTKLFDQKKDIRSMGSGNAGATNVLRSVGVKAAIFTFIFDFIAFMEFLQSFYLILSQISLPISTVPTCLQPSAMISTVR